MSETEMIDVVDEDENIIETVTKAKAMKNNLLALGAGCIVFNSKGRMLLTKRAATKKIYPNHWDLISMGWVISGEKPEQTARRETGEEIGAKDFEMKFLFKFRYKDDMVNDIDYVFRTEYNGELKLQDEEVAEHKWVTLKGLDRLIKKLPIHPPHKFMYDNFKDKMK